MFKQLAKDITQDSSLVWGKSKYLTFLANASRDELLGSQVPFYYAVEAFPLLLLQLASKISNENARCLIVENIWEEHGHGQQDKFHTHTFKKHLVALGFEGNYFKNPFITEWIRDLLEIDSLCNLFHKLAAIEYMYAVISASISGRLQHVDLLCEQEHYQNHSKLDWSHGEDILISMNLSGIDFNETTFKNAQLNFINLFSKMVVPTQKETEYANSILPISFYHTREAVNVINDVIYSFNNKTEIDVLTVCSGGEGVIHYLSHDCVSSITAFDMNKAQLELCTNKISSNYSTENRGVGKFEYLFELVRGYFINYNNEQMIVQDYAVNCDALNYVLELVFNNHVLSMLFSDEATKYSIKPFSEHFKLVYAKMIDDINDETITNINSENVILGTEINAYFTNIDKSDKAPITYLNQSAKTVLSQEKKYHVIDLSNIGDWMPYTDFQQLITQAFERLHMNGRLVLRRLLGDYSLTNLAVGQIVSLYDETGFYSQTVMIKK
jgi:hypothetical protein